MHHLATGLQKYDFKEDKLYSHFSHSMFCKSSVLTCFTPLQNTIRRKSVFVDAEKLYIFACHIIHYRLVNFICHDFNTKTEHLYLDYFGLGLM